MIASRTRTARLIAIDQQRVTLDHGQGNTAKGTQPRERFMNKLIIPAVLEATGMATAAAWSQATPPFQNKRYFTMPLEKDPTRQVGLQSVTMPPGAGNQFHRHPGDQWTAVQEGEVTFTVKGQPPQVLKAGDRITFRAAPFTASRISPTGPRATSRSGFSIRTSRRPKPSSNSDSIGQNAKISQNGRSCPKCR